jgi:hypothetical protein
MTKKIVNHDPKNAVKREIIIKALEEKTIQYREDILKTIGIYFKEERPK